MTTIIINTQCDIDQINKIKAANPDTPIETITALYLQNKRADKMAEIGEMVLPMLMNVGSGIKEIKESFLPS